MKKLFYTLFALTLMATAAQAQFVTVLVNGQINNTGGTIIPITLSTDSFITSTTTYSDSSGYFSDSLQSFNSQGIVFLSFVNCYGDTQIQAAFFNPALMVVNFTVDYCPGTSGGPYTVYINGVFTDLTGPVDVTFVTDSMPLGTTVTIAPPGNINAAVLVGAYASPITASFTDCSGVLQTETIYVTSGTVVANYYPDYCDTTTTAPPCGTLYTASYDASTNAFTLMMDSGLSAFTGQYMWDFGDGSTSTDMYPTHTFATNGIYNVCLTITTPTGSSCTYCHELGIDSVGNVVLRTDAGFTVNVVPFGATAIPVINPTSFDVFPNPVSDVANVSFYADNADRFAIEIFSVTGQRMKSFEVEAQTGYNEFKLPVSDLAKGSYLMNVRFTSKTISRSFIK